MLEQQKYNSILNHRQYIHRKFCPTNLSLRLDLHNSRSRRVSTPPAYYTIASVFFFSSVYTPGRLNHEYLLYLQKRTIPSSLSLLRSRASLPPQKSRRRGRASLRISARRPASLSLSLSLCLGSRPKIRRSEISAALYTPHRPAARVCGTHAPGSTIYIDLEARAVLWGRRAPFVLDGGGVPSRFLCDCQGGTWRWHAPSRPGVLDVGGLESVCRCATRTGERKRDLFGLTLQGCIVLRCIYLSYFLLVMLFHILLIGQIMNSL